MKKVALGFGAAMLLSVLGFAAQAPKAMTYKGEIMDSDCAKDGKHPDPDAASCTLNCIKNGAHYVLFNAADKTVYQLDDQKKPVAFAGKAVAVTGTMDAATKTIHVTTIKAG